MKKEGRFSQTFKILNAMLLGLVLGVVIHFLPESAFKKTMLVPFVIEGLLDLGGKVFITLLKFAVVPIVLISLICGMIENLQQRVSLKKVALKTVFLYLLTTAIAISLALLLAKLLNIGSNNQASIEVINTMAKEAPSIKATFLNIFPTNPFRSLAEGNMLQIIFIAILFGSSISKSGAKGKSVSEFFKSLNAVMMQVMEIILYIAPIGVFCLIAKIFASVGFSLVGQMLGYFSTVILVLFIQLFVTYGLFLKFYAKLHPFNFFKKMASAMLFAFSTSSSNASIPVVLHCTEKKLGVDKSIASFIIPLGATINMDGTAIMQGVATVFIANYYHISLGLTSCLKVVLMATLASIGTAGVPGIGLITLSMVLMQVNIPVEGIALIIGIDRLLDMCRTAVNVCGDATVACCVARDENLLEDM